MKLNNKDFYILWGEALTSSNRELFMAEWSTSEMFGEADLLENADYVNNVWDVAHMSIHDICKTACLTQTAMAIRFCIPKRTVEDWCRGIAKCADYLRLMMAEALGLLQR